MTWIEHEGARGYAPEHARLEERLHDGQISERLFGGPGEMRALCREMDWAATPLGPAEEWPSSLRTAAGLVLAAPTAMIVLWGPRLVQIYNDSYREVMGTKHPGGLGQPTQECWPEVWDFNAPLYENVVRRRETFTFTDQRLVLERHGQPEEAFFTLTYSPIPDDGSVGGVLVTVYETTEQVRGRDAQEQEREQMIREAETSEAKYRTLFDSIDAGFCILEMIFDGDRPVDYRFVEANPAFERQTGLVDAIGHTAREMVPALEAHWFEIYGRVAATGEATRFQNGSDPMGRWFDVYAFPIGNPEERLVALLFTDITTARAAEAERERLLQDAVAARASAEVARQRADEANRAQSEFLAVMSHELRTPLNAIGGYAELVEIGVHGPVTAAQRQALERIQSSQRHLLGLINEVLNYARVETGTVRFDIDDVLVGQLIASAETLVAPQIHTKGLGYHFSGCDPALAVCADAEKTRQILLNLLTNAIKFTDEGGQITMACTKSGDTVAISVADTGRGVPADKLASIFEPFVQVDARLTRTQEGVGLGLAISRDLARGMGGDLTAESTPGMGSTFTLTLPVA